MAGRVDQSMPVGNEGAGVVVAAGASAGAQALLGRTVAMLGGGMYAQYRCIKAAQCLVLPPGTSAAEGASCFVNPLTALGMVETMRREGHTALVHTAAASNLGQMLNRLCIRDGVGLVNIVRTERAGDDPRAIGAKYVCNSSEPTFMARSHGRARRHGRDARLRRDRRRQARRADPRAAWRAALTRSAEGIQPLRLHDAQAGVRLRRRSTRGPTELNRNFGLAWGIGGWLLTPFLQKIGPDAAQKLRERVAAEIKTTFASHYTKVVSLAEALQLKEIAVYGKQATGEKYLINPNS